jgi:hypothetical protein
MAPQISRRCARPCNGSPKFWLLDERDNWPATSIPARRPTTKRESNGDPDIRRYQCLVEGRTSRKAHLPACDRAHEVGEPSQLGSFMACGHRKRSVRHRVGRRSCDGARVGGNGPARAHPLIASPPDGSSHFQRQGSASHSVQATTPFGKDGIKPDAILLPGGPEMKRAACNVGLVAIVGFACLMQMTTFGRPAFRSCSL